MANFLLGRWVDSRIVQEEEAPTRITSTSIERTRAGRPERKVRAEEHKFSGCTPLRVGAL